MGSNEFHPSTLAARIRDAHTARREQAHEVYADALAAADLEADGIFLNTVRRHAAGVEPQWLIRAKQLHDQLGRYIYVLSQREEMDLPHDAIQEAERGVKGFVDRQWREVTTERTDAAVFLAVVNMVASRHPLVTPVLDAGQPAAEIVCFVYSMHDLEIAVKLADEVQNIALLLERWADRTPRKPTKWGITARLWKNATGRVYDAETWRRWDPRKKQVLPRKVST